MSFTPCPYKIYSLSLSLSLSLYIYIYIYIYPQVTRLKFNVYFYLIMIN